MTPRQKLLDAIDHRPGPVPADFGSTGVTGIHASCVEALRRHYGLDEHPVKICEPFQMLGEIEPDLVEALGSDAIGISGRGTMFGFAQENWKEWRTPWGQTVLVPGEFRVSEDSTGDVFIYPEGDTSAPASGHMPRRGFFFDAIVRQEPIDEDRLDPHDNCEEFKPTPPKTSRTGSARSHACEEVTVRCTQASAARASATSRSCPRRS
jgi:hypothetical protein